MDQKHHALHRAHDRFLSMDKSDIHKRFDEWTHREGVSLWLEDYTLFKALKKENDDKSWISWPEDVRKRHPEAIEAAKTRLVDDLNYQEFIQFLFFDQWNHIRSEAATRGIEIIGDAPIYVSFDSADTWANQSEFELDADGLPTAVAGVPPDYFCATGQLRPGW